MVKKIQDIVITALLITAILIPLLTFNREPGKISELENRPLAQFPQIINPGRGLAPGIKSNIESWFNDNLGMRETLVQANANIQYGFLHRSPSEKVVLGKGEWLFYAIEHNLDIARGTYPLNEDTLLAISKYHEENHSLLTARGIKYAVTFPPSKVSIYPEMLASGDYLIRETPCETVQQYLEGNSGIRVIGLKPILLHAKEDAQVYYSMDSHWNHEGAYAAYLEILAQLTEWGAAEGEPARVSLAPGVYKGDLVKLMGNPSLIADEEVVNTVIDAPRAHRIDSGSVHENFIALKDTYGYHDIVAYENPGIDGKRLLIIGDSIFSKTIPELLAQNVSLAVYVWDPKRRLSPALLDAVDPDFVLYEMGERNFAGFYG